MNINKIQVEKIHCSYIPMFPPFVVWTDLSIRLD